MTLSSRSEEFRVSGGGSPQERAAFIGQSEYQGLRHGAGPAAA